jgi:hypothetical protein
MVAEMSQLRLSLRDGRRHVKGKSSLRGQTAIDKVVGAANHAVRPASSLGSIGGATDFCRGTGYIPACSFPPSGPSPSPLTGVGKGVKNTESA